MCIGASLVGDAPPGDAITVQARDQFECFNSCRACVILLEVPHPTRSFYSNLLKTRVSPLVIIAFVAFSTKTIMRTYKRSGVRFVIEHWSLYYSILRHRLMGHREGSRPCIHQRGNPLQPSIVIKKTQAFRPENAS